MRFSKIPLILPVVFILLASTHTWGHDSSNDSISTKKQLIIEPRVDWGKVIPTNNFVRYQNANHDGIDDYFSYSLRLAWQTKGNKLWQQLYGYPAFGIGAYSAIFKETSELGYPIAVYGFFNGPFVRLNRFSLNYELGLGLTFNWNHFDPLTNPNNVAISAEESVYIDAGVSLKYQMSNRLAFALGYGFTHFSNGKLKMPNKGLNTQAARISLSYALKDEPVQFKRQPVPPFKDRHEWLISFYGGMQNVLYTGPDTSADPTMRGINLPVFGVNNTINRQVDYKSKVGIGMTIGYNGSQNATVIEEDGNLDELDVPFKRHITVSIYPSYELAVDHLSLVIQPGFYLYRKKTTNMTPGFYQRIGVKYHFMKDYFFGVNLRANKFYKSEFIEWTIGHRIHL